MFQQQRQQQQQQQQKQQQQQQQQKQQQQHNNKITPITLLTKKDLPWPKDPAIIEPVDILEVDLLEVGVSDVDLFRSDGVVDISVLGLFVEEGFNISGLELLELKLVNVSWFALYCRYFLIRSFLDVSSIGLSVAKPFDVFW